MVDLADLKVEDWEWMKRVLEKQQRLKLKVLMNNVSDGLWTCLRTQLVAFEKIDLIQVDNLDLNDLKTEGFEMRELRMERRIKSRGKSGRGSEWNQMNELGLHPRCK